MAGTSLLRDALFVLVVLILKMSEEPSKDPEQIKGARGPCGWGGVGEGCCGGGTD